MLSRRKVLEQADALERGFLAWTNEKADAKRIAKAARKMGRRCTVMKQKGLRVARDGRWVIREFYQITPGGRCWN